MGSPGEMDTWAEAASNALFVFYEVRAPEPNDRWAGGYGWRSASEIVELSIHHHVSESEIVVTTSVVDPDIPSAHSEALVRYQALVSLMSGVFTYDELESLPMVVGFAQSAATIAIDGIDVVFDGIECHKNGELLGWSGSAIVEGLRVSLTATPGPVAGIALAPCTNLSMSDGPKRIG